MLFYLLSMFTFAQEPAMSITVVDSPYEEIYMEGFFIGLAPKKGVFYYHSNYDQQ